MKRNSRLMRFTKLAYPTVYFSERIWVRCPDCDDIGLVETKLGKYTIPFPHDHKSTFNCKKCGLTKESDQEWFGYYQGFCGRGCGFCGSKISYTTEPTKKTYHHITIKCDVCKKEKNYRLKWYRYKEDKPTDPYFGLELWLQTNVKDNTLWIYNIEHLSYLREYVASKLREDDNRHKYSMITNLPQWIKSAKNRELILKKLDNFEKELIIKMAHNSGS
jgi:transcription elongation factor Elf1